MPLGDFLCPFPLQHKQKVGCTHSGGTCLGHPGAPRGDEGVADPEPTLNSPECGVMGTTPPTLLLGSSTPSPTLCIRSGSRTRTRTPPPLFSQPFFPQHEPLPPFPAPLTSRSRAGTEATPSSCPQAMRTQGELWQLVTDFSPSSSRNLTTSGQGHGERPHHVPPCPQNPSTPPVLCPRAPGGCSHTQVLRLGHSHVRQVGEGRAESIWVALALVFLIGQHQGRG